MAGQVINKNVGANAKIFHPALASLTGYPASSTVGQGQLQSPNLPAAQATTILRKEHLKSVQQLKQTELTGSEPIKQAAITFYAGGRYISD